MRTVHCYIRVSTLDKQTTEQQEEACRRSYSEDVTFEMFKDKLSGWKDIKRPQYDLLKMLISRGSVKELVVYSVSRLGRNVQEAAQFLTLCQNKGVKVKVITEGLDFSSPMGFALYTLFAALAQMDSDMKSQRIKEKFRYLKEQDEFVGHGRAPHTISEKIVDKAPEVYQMLDRGCGYRYIAKMLTISEHTVGKLAKLRDKPLITAKIFAKLFPCWSKMRKEDYPTQEQVFAAYRKFYKIK